MKTIKIFLMTMFVFSLSKAQTVDTINYRVDSFYAYRFDSEIYFAKIHLDNNSDDTLLINTEWLTFNSIQISQQDIENLSLDKPFMKIVTDTYYELEINPPFVMQDILLTDSAYLYEKIINEWRARNAPFKLKDNKTYIVINPKAHAEIFADISLFVYEFLNVMEMRKKKIPFTIILELLYIKGHTAGKILINIDPKWIDR